jgi:hypothetical protein
LSPYNQYFSFFRGLPIGPLSSAAAFRIQGLSPKPAESMKKRCPKNAVPGRPPKKA